MLFTQADVAEITQQVKYDPKYQLDIMGRTLAARLSEIASRYVADRLQKNKPTPSKVAGGLERIASAAKDLLKRLPKVGALDAAIHDRLAGQASQFSTAQKLVRLPSGAHRLGAVINEIEDLIYWAEAAHQHESNLIGKSPAHQREEAIRNLILECNGAWMEFWGRSPATTIDGPYIRFVESFAAAMNGKLSRDDALDVSRESLKVKIRETALKKKGDHSPSVFFKVMDRGFSLEESNKALAAQGESQWVVGNRVKSNQKKN